MCVSYDALFGVLSDRQTFPLKWAFEGGLDDMSVQRPVSERFVVHAYAQTNPRPTNQRGNDPLACGYDGFFRGHRLLFNFRAVRSRIGSCRHSSSE